MVSRAYLMGGGGLGGSIYFLKSEGKEVERKRIKNKKGCEGGGVPVTIFLEVEIFSGGGGNSRGGVEKFSGGLKIFYVVEKFSGVDG